RVYPGQGAGSHVAALPHPQIDLVVRADVECTAREPPVVGIVAERHASTPVNDPGRRIDALDLRHAARAQTPEAGDSVVGPRLEPVRVALAPVPELRAVGGELERAQSIV